MSGEIDEEVEKRALRRQKPHRPILTTQSQRTNQKRRNQVLTFVLGANFHKLKELTKRALFQAENPSAQ